MAVEPDWNTILTLFEEALNRPASERAEWLRGRCGSDEGMLKEVGRLLAAHERETGLLEEPINPLAVEALGEEGLELKQIGPYRVLSEIGRGGMGVVYCAEDTQLGRQVALKALPGPYTADPRRMARFRREAQTLASLNHPNIASLYGLEDSGDAPILVMELVDGATLSEQIAQQPIPIEEALPIGSQIAKALEAAHDKGVIHRDLKPANIKVKTDGTVKVLDFGIAKALDEREVTESLRESPAPFPATTPTGFILGTAGYMSPEQARGKGVDKRSDIWAFGVVLYEMLTGRQAFGGDSASDTVAAIIRGVPDWEALPSDTPRAVKQLLLRCLEKDPRRRLRDIGEARIVLDDLMDPHTGAAAVADIGEPQSPAVAGKSATQSWIGWVVAAALLAVAVVGWLRVGESGNEMVRKLELPVTGRFSIPVISPDGRRVAFLHEERVWVRDLDRLTAREIPDSEGAESVFWSPDSAWVGFGAKDRLWKAPANGGGASVICLVPGGFYPDASGAWIDGDRVLFSTGGSGLLEVSANGGDPVEVVAPDAEIEIDFHGVNPLPDGRGVVFVAHRLAAMDTLAVYAGGERRDILQLQGQTLETPRFAASGHLLYHRKTGNPGVWALPFDRDSFEVTADPFLVLANAHSPSISADGTLALVRGPGPPLRQLYWADRRGRELETLGEPRSFERLFNLSPDGSKLAVSVLETGDRDLWVYDLERGTHSHLTSDPLPEASPAWDREGARLVYYRGADILMRAVNGSEEPEVLAQGRFPVLSPDGRWLLYAAPGSNSAYYDIWRMALDGGQAVKLVASEARKSWPSVSPDGRLLAYMSDETGSFEIYLTEFPSGNGKWQVSTSGGRWPRWSRDGRRITYSDSDRSVMEVEITTSPALRLGTPQKLFDRPRSIVSTFDIAPDEERFLLMRTVSDENPPVGVTLIENWSAEFPGR